MKTARYVALFFFLQAKTFSEVSALVYFPCKGTLCSLLRRFTKKSERCLIGRHHNRPVHHRTLEHSNNNHFFWRICVPNLADAAASTGKTERKEDYPERRNAAAPKRPSSALAPHLANRTQHTFACGKTFSKVSALVCFLCKALYADIQNLYHDS